VRRFSSSSSLKDQCVDVEELGDDEQAERRFETVAKVKNR
jgi:hypothetical protein